MNQEEARMAFIRDWKIGPDRENVASAAFDRGWWAGRDQGKAEVIDEARRRRSFPPSALSRWAKFARSQRRHTRPLDPRSMAVEMIWSAGTDRRAWDEIHDAIEVCAWLVRRGVLRTRGSRHSMADRHG